jgi:uncharacterized protein
VKILVAGGNGFIGPALISQFVARGDTVIALVRSVAAAQHLFPPEVPVAGWDGRTVGAWGNLMNGVDAVVNLSGASIAGARWTPARKELIRASRVAPTRALIEAMRAANPRPAVLLNVSAVGYYGMAGEGVVTEQSAPGTDFLGTVCQEWEKEARSAASLGVRVVLPRLGVVLASEGGALERMVLPYRLFAGGRIGSGQQWYPWVHRDDAIAVMLFLLDHAHIEGPINVVAPELVRMRELAAELGHVLGRPSWFPVPSFVLKTLLGEMAGMILNGRQILPERLQREGFPYRFPTLRTALASIFS